MRQAAITVLAALAAVAAADAAGAQTVHRGGATAPPTWPTAGDGYAGTGDDGGDGLNAFFYPDGYDPQYGSEGRLPDAADFAAGYGCLPVWDGKYGQYVEACNR